ncbi:MAG: hypothetical protein COX07_01020 [Bacteroidetes bacterium CG23_combo_of_CG06-09_8_20_14_all_32_9]|nr:MAG: hypothetical protein COX07_01020 [Bacteroidetes bacterium CG23_combo_of_CG06-09_8_20_14_all_32_9]
MSVEIREVFSKCDLLKFVKFPFSLYKGSKFWVPPIINDEVKMLLPKYNPAFSHCKAKFWLAYKDGKIAGRIAAIINEAFNEKSGEKNGRYSRLEFINDYEVVESLTKTAENWLREQGMTTIMGPLGFNNLDHQGMLIEGFDHLPSIASEYHKPYYREHLEKLGYEKEIDWVEFRLTLGDAAVEKANRGASLIQKRYGIEVVHFKKMAELLPYSDTIFNILNDAFSELPFVSAFSPQMMAFYKEKYIKILNPEFVKMVKLKGEMVGFIIGLPSLSEAMQKANGKLFPFGFLHILKARKGKDVMDQLLTGVKKEVISTGAGVILMAEIQKQMLSKGMKFIETTGIFETNFNAISNWKNYEHIQHKRKRCFRKTL